MSSAIYFSLDRSKILSSGNGLKDFNIQIAQKTLLEKVKLLFLSNFIFSLNVFLKLFSSMC